MDTTNIGSEVPAFKLAKVGAGRKSRRKGAGIPWLRWGRQAGSGIAMEGGVGGGVSTVGLSALAAKASVALLVAALGVGAYSVGKSLAPDGQDFAAKKPQLFASKASPKYEGDLSNLPGGRTVAPSGLGMVSGSLDGLTPEQRAAKAKAEADAAKAEAEAQAKADAEAAKEPAAANGAPADPAAALAAAMGGAGPGAKKGFVSKVNTFGQGMGGFSGGINPGASRNFDAPKFKADSGKLVAMGNKRASVFSTQSRAAGGGVGRHKGLARSQLSNAFRQSNAARGAGPGETSAAQAAAPFDNNPGQGSVISGVGAGNGAPLSGAGVTSPNPNTGGTTSGAIDSTEEPALVSGSEGKNVTPWQGLVNMAAMLLTLASILLLAAWICSYIKPWGYIAAQYLAYAACAVAAMVTMIGVAIMGMGQTLQGLCFTGIGALVTVLAYLAAQGYKSAGEKEIAQQGAQKAADQAAQNLQDSINFADADMDIANAAANTQAIEEAQAASNAANATLEAATKATTEAAVMPSLEAAGGGAAGLAGAGGGYMMSQHQ